MSNIKKAIELAKVIIAYFCTFGVVVVPLPLLWYKVVKLQGTDYANLALLVGVLTALPILYLSLYVSYRLGRWFLVNWGKEYIDPNE